MGVQSAEPLPCPFCGERLQLKADHHGQWWAHRDEVGPCHASVDQLFDDDDISNWNRRAPDTARDDAIRAEVYEVCIRIAKRWEATHAAAEMRARATLAERDRQVAERGGIAEEMADCYGAPAERATETGDEQARKDRLNRQDWGG